MSIFPEIFPAYNPSELAASIIRHYDHDIRILREESNDEGDSNEQCAAEEKLGNLSAYVEKQNPENLAFLKKDVGCVRTPFTEKTIKKLTENNLNSCAYVAAANKARLLNTPDGVWSQAIQIVEEKLGSYARMGFMEEELRRPSEFTYVGTLMARGPVDKFTESERNGTERELTGIEKFLESPGFASLFNLDYVGYLCSVIEKLQSKNWNDLLFLSGREVVHAIHDNNGVKLRYFARTYPQFAVDEDRKKEVVKEDVVIEKNSMSKKAEELIAVGFEVKEIDEAKSGELPEDLQHFTEDPLKSYGVFEKLKIDLD
jgi:hypothetical protein